MTNLQDWKNMWVMDIKQITHKETHTNRYTHIYGIFEAKRENLPKLGLFWFQINKQKQKRNLLKEYWDTE